MQFYTTSESVLLTVDLKDTTGKVITTLKSTNNVDSQLNTRLVEKLLEDDDIKLSTKEEFDEINRKCEKLLSTLKSDRHKEGSYISLPIRNGESGFLYLKGPSGNPKMY
jgi:hypothetical protein